MSCNVCSSPTKRHRKTCSNACHRAALAAAGAKSNPLKGPDNPYWLGGKKAHDQRHPERRRVGKKVLEAIKSGRLVRQPCQECGEVKVEAHHEDYSKPLEVIWLCRPHHRKADLELGWGPEANAHLSLPPLPTGVCKVCGAATQARGGRRNREPRTTCSDACFRSASSTQAKSLLGVGKVLKGSDHPDWRGGEAARRRRQRERRKLEASTPPSFPRPPASFPVTSP